MGKLRLQEIQDALATRLDEGGAVILTQAYVTPEPEILTSETYRLLPLPAGQGQWVVTEHSC